MVSLSSIAGLIIQTIRWKRVLSAYLMSPGRMHTGSRFIVGPSLRVARGRYLTAGDRVSIGRSFDCMANVIIGDDVMISSSVALIGNDHAFDDPNYTIQSQGLLPPSTIQIRGDNLIGYGVIILGNVTIGRGAIVGAGSLVCSDLPDGMICAGRPAKPIRPRFTTGLEPSEESAGAAVQ